LGGWAPVLIALGATAILAVSALEHSDAG